MKRRIVCQFPPIYLMRKGSASITFSTLLKLKDLHMYPTNSALTISKDDILVIDLVFIELVQTELVSSVSRGVNGKVQGSVRAYKTRYVDSLSKFVLCHAEGLPSVRDIACRRTTEGFNWVTIPHEEGVLFA